jgi:hypothetical protein
MPSTYSLRRLSRCAIEPAEEKDYDPGLGKGARTTHTYPIYPEPTTPRKPPALLAIHERNQLHERGVVKIPAGEMLNEYHGLGQTK